MPRRIERASLITLGSVGGSIVNAGPVGALGCGAVSAPLLGVKKMALAIAITATTVQRRFLWNCILKA